MIKARVNASWSKPPIRIIGKTLVMFPFAMSTIIVGSTKNTHYRYFNILLVDNFCPLTSPVTVGFLIITALWIKMVFFGLFDLPVYRLWDFLSLQILNFQHLLLHVQDKSSLEFGLFALLPRLMLWFLFLINAFLTFFLPLLRLIITQDAQNLPYYY